jgi:sec-independent protein translocase protein TatC
VLKVSFAFGVAFEVPIATILLIMFGITTVEKLKNNRPYVIIGAFILGMLLTPPDIISQVLIAIPMWLLFEAGLIFAPMFKRKETTNDDSPTEPSTDRQNDEPLEDEDEDWDDAEMEAEMDKIDAEMKKLDKE